ncbi:MAG: hypothetical protein DMF84_25045 [Acidobacteria bacterium]|nr:MAG: hypothetical protein DMF84_25045 [Acidobacteriota bacterium]
MDPGFRSPLIDFFRRGEVARDVRLMAAQGALAPRAHEQLALLVLLADDPDPEIARATAATLAALPEDPLRAFLARSDVPDEMRKFFAARGVETAGVAPSDTEAPLIDTLAELAEVPGTTDDAEADRKLLSSLPVLERMKLAMKGTREQRAQLVRDSNKLVSAAVLSSPKLTSAEVEAFTKMGNVSEDVLRIIATNRSWTKNYGVIAGLCRHPKTPPAMSMHMLHRLNERDLKMLSIDRNVPEALRQLSKKVLTKAKQG